MLWLLRGGAYLVSGWTIWQFLQGDTTGISFVPAHKHLALDPSRGLVFGVCAGISNYTGIDATILRFAWALSAFYRGAGIAVYILAFLIMPAG